MATGTSFTVLAAWGGAAAVVAAVGVAVVLRQDNAVPTSDDAAPEPAVAVVQEPSEARAEPGRAAVDDTGVPNAGDAATTADPGASTAAQPDLPDEVQFDPPSFDVVRVDAGGGALVAGRAPGGFGVDIEVDGDILAQATADAGGSFAALFSVPATDGARIVALVAHGPSGEVIRSEDTVILAPATVAAVPPETVVDSGSASNEGDVSPSEQAAVSDDKDPTLTEEVDQEDAVASEQAEGGDLSEVEKAVLPTAPLDEGRRVEVAVAPSAVDASGAPAGNLLDESTNDDALGPEENLAAIPSSRDDPTETEIPLAGLDTSEERGDDAPSADVTTQEVQLSDRVPDVQDQATELTLTAEPAPERPRVSAGRPETADGQQSATTTPRAPTVLIARNEGVGLLQPAARGSGSLDQVVVDVISYDELGNVIIEGRGTGADDGATNVRLYLNNRPVESTGVAADGTWRLPLEEIDAGVYTLRVDQIDARGAVVSRFETPFKREEPAVLARVTRGANGTELAASVITVQPGFTLWGIASDRYGDGLRYVQVFEANRDQIRDPDLIYPGQVFDLPDGEN